MPYWRARLDEIINNLIDKVTGRKRPEPELPDWIVGMRDHWVIDDKGKILMPGPDCAKKNINIQKNGDSTCCYGCGAFVRAGPSYCPYCGREYKGNNEKIIA